MTLWNVATANIKRWVQKYPDRKRAFLLSKQDVMEILAQSKDVVAIRSYNGENLNGEMTQFWVGCVRNSTGGFDDYLPSTDLTLKPIVKGTLPCPDFCSLTKIFGV